tara:strand:- start:185 stop:727 length:543 start_codon:yes stop_codon:yes gene_type:complete
MRLFFILGLIFILSNCTKTKTVLICGDHICVNNKEADQFFEENLSIEVRIVDNKVKKEINLIELNLSENNNGERKVIASSKPNINRKLKTLSSDEIIVIKKNLKNKKKDRKIAKKVITKNKKLNKIKKANNINKIDEIENIKINTFDVCEKIDKCSIKEISKYLLKVGKKKDFPDLTERQ